MVLKVKDVVKQGIGMLVIYYGDSISTDNMTMSPPLDHQYGSDETENKRAKE